MDAAAIADVAILVCRIVAFLIFVRAISSWFTTRRDHPILRFLDEMTDPILSPLRSIMPHTGGVDFTPMIAMILLVYVVPLVLETLIGSG